MSKNSQLVRGYEVVIGLENHVQLSTVSKIFSGSSTAFGAAPNTQASAVDLALPGTLPVLNRGAVERAIRFGLAVGAKVAPLSIFARKNYFYPDLPKGYQISQYEIPVVQGGQIEFFVGDEKKVVKLTRAHLEEDAGKSLHEDYHGQSGIDLNRAGTPLLEIVSEPEMRSGAEAVEYAKTLHALVMWLGICDGNMQEGSFRCDVNVSVRKPGEPFGTRREIKNLNSFRYLVDAVNYEVNWQIDQIEDGLEIQQATVLYNPDTGETRAMRTKEDAADYRYFPDPDLPPLMIGADWVERVRGEMPELPSVMAARFQEVDGLPAYDATMMTQSLATARFYEAAREACGAPKLVANWVMGEISRRLNTEERAIDDAPVTPALLAALIKRIQDGTISNNAAKQVFEALWTGEGQDVDALIEAKGLKQMSDTGELERILDEVLAANAKSVEEFRAGKEKAFNALVGQAMKATKGKANPAAVNELLKKKLGA
ncbi:Asp-tRNA(Asn)/Glu-tRNA(Gln) amidotransferase subunit GatB [Mitsuaria sp. TWR114]|uniref:Asp-tRNA(Asn)/Glu-tRNA(Gln) amidotransferase subunit GatB n=1 Tax=unclassified Roseateles TaxID=2626991 RepID=UPI0008E219F0|nr:MULTISPECIES: Asp-tRNA(Asn)/Glu-tRNA(Gln) amidotransferase subunit GatB [unclassified Roseateles]MBB3283975.1 aspartyl-tRNA(Asn)/glutamyl-tRNA(Gln) amidotransferase subunit B [Mitsuaria sp. BK037]MBB3296014.1 aspartyl-tRNA(Asn)/glutamyl-tRNA(Gln) amidotransferase subunit B [Mitsuaria sp. BK041]MBB3365229.1 aspartyl-tRNA(Asn)/glutamyl-tRNA(Gln) amidotransferase subunit B [Mitsuaria sp. BK045]TXD80411.1 Asp-tRNA(Asn)/Glu-tRNA(Gln) amidotransferase subunit GatB [Mitsuaria sp. TWR114]SFR94691.1